ncbi:MAG: QacE family quaternary ammonium compound efflux SMR transporter [Puniceicoccales bacterium]|jgi:small multidrug resistance pump|nr:QacE family quaternary ammonium compound efflux SMR transporter [Puniceicoccales bacterium]
MKYVLLAIAILAEVIGTSALKTSESFTKLWPSLMVIICYGVAFYCLSRVLDSIPVGIAYAIWSGAGIAAITAIGWFFFKQSLDAPALLGIGLIIAGVVILNVFSKSAVH